MLYLKFDDEDHIKVAETNISFVKEIHLLHTENM